MEEYQCHVVVLVSICVVYTNVTNTLCLVIKGLRKYIIFAIGIT